MSKCIQLLVNKSSSELNLGITKNFSSYVQRHTEAKEDYTEYLSEVALRRDKVKHLYGDEG